MTLIYFYTLSPSAHNACTRTPCQFYIALVIYYMFILWSRVTGKTWLLYLTFILSTRYCLIMWLVQSASLQDVCGLYMFLVQMTVSLFNLDQCLNLLCKSNHMHFLTLKFLSLTRACLSVCLPIYLDPVDLPSQQCKSAG